MTVDAIEAGETKDHDEYARPRKDSVWDTRLMDCRREVKGNHNSLKLEAMALRDAIVNVVGT